MCSDEHCFLEHSVLHFFLGQMFLFDQNSVKKPWIPLLEEALYTQCKQGFTFEKDSQQVQVCFQHVQAEAKWVALHLASTEFQLLLCPQRKEEEKDVSMHKHPHIKCSQHISATPFRTLPWPNFTMSPHRVHWPPCMCKHMCNPWTPLLLSKWKMRNRAIMLPCWFLIQSQMVKF